MYMCKTTDSYSRHEIVNIVKKQDGKDVFSEEMMEECHTEEVRRVKRNPFQNVDLFANTCNFSLVLLRIILEKVGGRTYRF